MDLRPPVPWPDTPRPMVDLHPRAHHYAMAMRRGDVLPTQVSTYTLTHVMNLRAQGLTFHDTARRAPECLSPSGAYLVYITALWATASAHLQKDTP